MGSARNSASDPRREGSPVRPLRFIRPRHHPVSAITLSINPPAADQGGRRGPCRDVTRFDGCPMLERGWQGLPVLARRPRGSTIG